MELINKYFPNITDEQRQRFAALDALYRDWNSKINVISRKDIDNLMHLNFKMPHRAEKFYQRCFKNSENSK